MNRLAAAEGDREVESGNGDFLLDQALEVHFDTRFVLVPASAMHEKTRPETRAQLAADAREDVAIEIRCYPGRIVVSGQQRVAILDVIYAQQQQIAGGQLGAQAAQQGSGLRRFEVADARSDVQHQAASAGVGISSSSVV